MGMERKSQVISVGERLKEYGLTLVDSSLKEPEAGRIAHNVIANTNQGRVLLRTYGASYSHNQVRAEVEALKAMAQAGLPVPVPLQTQAGEFVLPHQDGSNAFVYKLLLGKSLEQSEIDPDYARQAGALLVRFFAVAQKFSPSTIGFGLSSASPVYDIGRVTELFLQLRSRAVCQNEHKNIDSMAGLLSDELLIRGLQNTPQGLVHGDFFFENVLLHGGCITAIIDYGDCFYGALLNDIALGAMEFSVLPDGCWDMGCLKAFLGAAKGWLFENSIDSDLFLSVMKFNCIRFAAHTFRVGDVLGDNPYMKRFQDLHTKPIAEQVLDLLR
jgi:Ser/Thr protein kinase RdoA (MazF antagonist)